MTNARPLAYQAAAISVIAMPGAGATVKRASGITMKRTINVWQAYDIIWR